MKKIAVILLLVVVSLQGFSTPGKKQIRIRLTDSTSFVYDETSIYLDLGSPQFVFPEDGRKIFDTASSAPSVYSFSSDNLPCFSNSYGSFVPASVIPIGFKVANAGTFKFSATLLDNFDATTIVQLEDRTLGMFYDLRQGDYTVYMSQPQQDNGRFFIHASYPSLLSTIDAGCSNNDGNILIVQDSSIRWSSCSLYTDSFNLINTYNNITGNISFSGLPFGKYKMVFTYGSYTAIKDVVLNGNSVTVAVSASSLTGVVGQPMQFFSTASHTTDYLWSFGEGSQISGIMNPAFVYHQAGVYTVSLSASNSYVCSSAAAVTVTISEATGINQITSDELSINAEGKTLRVSFTKPLESEGSLQIYSATGQLVLANTISSNQTTTDLSYLSSSIYIVKVQNARGGFSKKIVLE